MTTLTRPELELMATHDVITGAELRAAGVSKGSLRTLLRRQHLFRAHEDVFWTTDPRDGIPVTSLHRTLDDIARAAAPALLKAAVGRAERQYGLDLAALYDEATSPNLKRVLATYVAGRGLTDSELEALVFDLVATYTSLDRPEMQRRQAGGRVDFVWPKLGLIVEVDGWETHRGKVAFHEDRRRDRANRRQGLDTLRFTWDDVVLTPREVADDIEFAASSGSTFRP